MSATQVMLDLLNASFPDIAAMEPLEARKAVDLRIRPAENLEDAIAVDHHIPTNAGELRVRVYTPHSLIASRPVTVYAHGGGFLHGSIEGHDSFCRTWAKSTSSTIISVDYRLAPEHGAPAPAEDVVSAAHWVGQQFQDPAIVLAGDSSGANAAAVAALELREDTAVHVTGQILLYPFLDPTMSSRSHTEHAEGYFVTNRSLRMYWDTYLNAPGSSEAPEWKIDPTLAESHTNLPPAIIYTGGKDPLTDEGYAYFKKLQGAGVPATYRLFPEQFHGFATIPGYPPAQAAQHLLWSDFNRMFTRS